MQYNATAFVGCDNGYVRIYVYNNIGLSLPFTEQINHTSMDGCSKFHIRAIHLPIYYCQFSLIIKISNIAIN